MNWLAVFLLTVHLSLLALPFRLAQDNGNTGGPVINISDAGSQSVFGEKISFKATIQPTNSISEVLVSFTPQGQKTRLEKMSLDTNGLAVYEIPTQMLPMAPFTQISYFFEAHLTNGIKIISQTLALQYDDTRFTWQSQESGIFKVYWNSSDATLGQNIINAAQSGLEKAQNILAVEPPTPLRIYAYSSARDLQQALALTGQSWVAGHASPELGMILVSIPKGPEMNLEIQRQIPHEIMHLLQYQVVGKNYSLEPVWLVEGMASLAELYPNPNYRLILEDTAKSDQLIRMDSLCQAFPSQAAAAFRAYAQSESFVRFLYTTYGNASLHKLLDQYQSGLGCTEAVSAVYGSSLGQLEYRWKQEVLGLNASGLALNRLAPYLLVGLLFLIPAAISFWPFRASKQTQPGPVSEEK